MYWLLLRTTYYDYVLLTTTIYLLLLLTATIYLLLRAAGNKITGSIGYWLLTIDYWLSTIDYRLFTYCSGLRKIKTSGPCWLLTIDYWLFTYYTWLREVKSKPRLLFLGKTLKKNDKKRPLNTKNRATLFEKTHKKKKDWKRS